MWDITLGTPSASPTEWINLVAHPRRRRLAACALPLGLVVGLALTAATSPPPHPEIPVLGVFTYDNFGKASGVPVVGAVHAVISLDGATGVYYSVGVAQDQAPQGFHPVYLSPSFNPYKPNDAAHVTLIDSQNLTAYKPLAAERGLVSSNIGAQAPAGQLLVLYALFPALPSNTTTVDLQFEFGATVSGVPITDQRLGPTVTQDYAILGEGWPEFPGTDLIAQADPGAVTFDLISRSEDVAGTVQSQETSTEVEVSLSADFFFPSGSSSLEPAALVRIEELANQISARAGTYITVTGHTDSVVDKVVGNQQLSQDRAEAVGLALVSSLGPGAMPTTLGKADSEPVATNSTDAGRAQNRRVTVTYQVTNS